MKWFSETNLAFDENEIKTEAALMSVLEHPNLVTYVGACLKPGSMFIITELYPAKYTLSHLTEPCRFSRNEPPKMAAVFRRSSTTERLT